MARLKRLSRSSHRWLGVIVMLPLIVASITGVVLNHTVDLGLSEKRVTHGAVLKRYGYELAGEPRAFGFGDVVRAGAWDGHIFFGKNSFLSGAGLIGVVPLRDGTAVVVANAVHYFGLDGELIETLDETSLPGAAFGRAGRDGDLRLVLDDGEQLWRADSDLLEFSEFAAGVENVQFSLEVKPTDADRENWRAVFVGEGLPLDRVILDIHSGKFFGPLGKWVWDVIVVGILVLSVTGFVLFFRTRRRR